MHWQLLPVYYNKQDWGLTMSIPTLLTVKQFSEKHQAFPEGSLRHLIFFSSENSLDRSGALVRNGRRILINEEKFFSWLLSKGDVKEAI